MNEDRAVTAEWEGAKFVTRDGWVDLHVMVVNTHTGRRVLTQGVPWLKAHYPLVSLYLLCEVQRPIARFNMRRVFPWRRWQYTGQLPPSIGPASSGTMIVSKRSRFKRVGKSNRLISKAIPGDKWHPSRRNTRARFHDLLSHHALDVTSLHLWALGRNPTEYVAQQHRVQASAYAMNARAAHENLDVAIAGGDANEWLDGDSLIEQLMTASGMGRATRAPGLEGLFVSKSVDVQVVRSEAITLPTPGDDHPVRYVVLRFRKLAPGETAKVLD